MPNLRRFSPDALEQLRLSISDRLDWYYDPVGQIPAELPPSGFRDAPMPAPEFADRLRVDMNPRLRPSDDVDNALVVYGGLSSLTPHQASFEGLWAYLCHYVCPQYVARRWLSNRPDDAGRAATDVHNHFFARDARGLIRDNALSRLWWLGKIAHDVDQSNPREFLTILLHRQDVRSALIDRPAISMNRHTLRAIYAVMREQWAGDQKLFERDRFRVWMAGLNRRGGIVLLDSLSDDALDILVRQEAEYALA